MENRPKKRFAFIGASGRIGTLLRSAYDLSPARDLEIIWQYRLADDQFNQLVWNDFSDPTPLLTWQEKYGKIDGLFIFCGVSSTGDKTSKAAMQGNIDLVRAVLSCADAAGIGPAFVASSSAVYGAGTGRPFGEDAPLDPVNAYGASKIEMEQLCAHRPSTCCLRIGNIAGADMLLQNALSKPANAALTLDVFPDGDGPRRSYIGPRSLALVLDRLASFDGQIPKVLNLGAPQPVAMNALLDAMNVAWNPRVLSASGHQDIVMHCDVLARICGLTEECAKAATLIQELFDVRAEL